MSTFSFNDYQNARNAYTQQSSQQSTQKVGFFKLANDNDMALVRINCSSTDDLMFASIHSLGPSMKWMKVGCLNEVGNTSGACPLCTAAVQEGSTITKASNKVYVPMLVSYKSSTPGDYSFSQPVPVIWERPASFATELVNKLQMYGDLKKVLLIITRHGAARDLKTTYSIDYAVPTIYSPDMIPEDFSAFNNFKIERHSFWSKSKADIETFLSTGSFPAIVTRQQSATVAPTQPAQATMQQPQYNPQPQYQQPITAAVNNMPMDDVPTFTPPQPQQTSQPQSPAQNETIGTESSRPVRNFNTFQF